ncbi:hypothetical protein [Nonomuraea sp. NPDC050202]|uniref:hypothetical protein n=1 Tax=Nonomuraea sp. NPDC050202 TaxID=3155035 RepID=UPI00340017DE
MSLMRAVFPHPEHIAGGAARSRQRRQSGPSAVFLATMRSSPQTQHGCLFHFAQQWLHKGCPLRRAVTGRMRWQLPHRSGWALLWHVPQKLPWSVRAAGTTIRPQPAHGSLGRVAL